MGDIEARLAAVERRQEEILNELASIRARLGRPGELSAREEVEIRELAKEINANGWPVRRRRKA